MSLHHCFLALLMTFMMPNDFLFTAGNELGMKLCGREFIRTVVMSCGGSRWKRYSPETEQARDTTYRDFIDWLVRDFVDYPEHLNSVNSEGHSVQASSPALRQEDGSMEQLQVHLYDTLVNEDDQNTHPRMKRSAGPAGSCCQRGCTKTELMKFC
ncbi:hypothetical protein GDO86_001039 [Hymenochirus boettgeri]|uniref:Insulin-like domain-containing protein n=1 Tax=Hymenochirus boettgeri TaxID=247094 RepID=A0A8T2KJW9_9PIPI|nr:hypothetical protein GDO86_001039 [Hymenochirus boettgeri]